MKKIIVMASVITILTAAMGFSFMAGFTDVGENSSLSFGTYLNDTTFVYAGLEFPMGITGGGGMTLGKIYTLDLKTEKGEKVGIFSISWGGVASAGSDFWGIPSFGMYGGPALFFNWNNINFIKGKLMWYSSFGLSFSTISAFSPAWASGVFYRF